MKTIELSVDRIQTHWKCTYPKRRMFTNAGGWKRCNSSPASSPQTWFHLWEQCVPGFKENPEFIYDKALQVFHLHTRKDTYGFSSLVKRPKFTIRLYPKVLGFNKDEIETMEDKTIVRIVETKSLKE